MGWLNIQRYQLKRIYLPATVTTVTRFILPERDGSRQRSINASNSPSHAVASANAITAPDGL